jgi:hypothetical protein
MNMKSKLRFETGLRIALVAALGVNLAACSTTASSTPSSTSAPATTTSTATTVIESALPLIRTGAAVATGVVLDFTVSQSSTRTRLANEMYAAASAIYSLSGGTFPSPAQLQSTVTAFGGSQADAGYAQFASGISSLYAMYYPQLSTGNAKTAADLLNALAGGIEDATQSYVTVPSASAIGASS